MPVDGMTSEAVFHLAGVGRQKSFDYLIRQNGCFRFGLAAMQDPGSGKFAGEAVYILKLPKPSCFTCSSTNPPLSNRHHDSHNHGD